MDFLKKLGHSKPKEETHKESGPKPTTEAAHQRLEKSHTREKSAAKTTTATKDQTHDIEFSASKNEKAVGNRFSWLGDDEKEDSKSQDRSNNGDNGYEGTSEWDPGRVASDLKDGVETLDSAAGGRHDGKFGVADLQVVANDPNADPKLRKAAQDMLADRNLMNGIDVAGGDDVDGTFSNQDLDKVIAESQGDNSPGLIEAHRGLSQNFDAFDSAENGDKDGKITQSDLRAIVDNDGAPEDQRKLAQQLLDDPTMWDAFDVATKDDKDGIVSKDDVEQVGYSGNPEAGQQWDKDQAEALERALDKQGQFGDQFSGINQTDRGNCVTTGAIKAGMDHFGNQIFQNVETREDGGYEVTMRDGQTVSLSKDEMEAAATAAHYQGDDPEAIAYANLAYAAAAKRAQGEGVDDSRTYAEALLALNDGAGTLDGVRWLGLENNVREIDRDEVDGKSSVLIDGEGHTFFVDTKNDGKTYADHWGNAEAYDANEDEGSFQTENAYELYG